jgi:hypothetical protein
MREVAFAKSRVNGWNLQLCFDLKVLMLQEGYLAGWAMTTLAPKT